MLHKLHMRFISENTKVILEAYVSWTRSVTTARAVGHGCFCFSCLHREVRDG
jgi:hypothetical protein